MLHRLLLFGALLAFLLSGCAVHAPVSETVIFHDPATHPAHERMTGIGVAGTYAPASAAVVEEARRHLGEDTRRTRDLQLNANRRSGGLYLASYAREGEFAFSGTLGVPVAGLDATLQLWRRNYLTVSASVPGHVQAYLQHRALNSPHWGAAGGVGYRRDRYGFEHPSGCAMCSDIDYVDVHSVGTRGFAVYRARGDHAAGVRMSVYAGYAPSIGAPVVDVTLSLGRF